MTNVDILKTAGIKVPWRGALLGAIGMGGYRKARNLGAEAFIEQVSRSPLDPVIKEMANRNVVGQALTGAVIGAGAELAHDVGKKYLGKYLPKAKVVIPRNPNNSIKATIAGAALTGGLVGRYTGTDKTAGRNLWGGALLGAVVGGGLTHAVAQGTRMAARGMGVHIPHEAEIIMRKATGMGAAWGAVSGARVGQHLDVAQVEEQRVKDWAAKRDRILIAGAAVPTAYVAGKTVGRVSKGDQA